MATLGGSTDITGGSDSFFFANDAGGSPFALLAGDITDIQMYVRESGAGNLKFAVYADSGGAPSGTKLAESNTTATGGPNGVLTATMATPFTVSAGTYWIEMMGDVTVNVVMVPGSKMIGKSQASFTFPSPWDATSNFSDNSNHLPIQVNGTLASAGAASLIGRRSLRSTRGLEMRPRRGRR